MAWLERAYCEGDPLTVTLKATPWLDFVRDDPRFTALLRRMGLEE
jgi:hypothetical protein